MPHAQEAVELPQVVNGNAALGDRSKLKSRVAAGLYCFLAIISGLGLAGKAPLIQRIIPLPVPLLYGIVICWVFLPCVWTFALRGRRMIAPLALIAVVVGSLFVYPHMTALQKTIRRGSDQADCVVAAAQGMARAEWPYDIQRMWSRDPMSCGPGWVLLQTPVTVAVGYRWNLLLLWALALLLLRISVSTNVVAGVVTLLGLSAITWVTACDGSDFLPFGIVLAALFVALQSRSKLDLLFLALLTLVVQFRFPMLILPVLLLPRRRVVAGCIVTIAAFAFQLIFLAWRPETYISDGPLHLFYKLTHTHLLALSRSTAIFEVTVVFICMLGIAVFARLYFASRWLMLAYLLVLTLIPAALDLAAKRGEFGSMLAALGIWEGANWMSDCIPLAAILLLSASRQLWVQEREPAGTRSAIVPL